MILVLGDSNMRQAFEAHKAEIEAAAGEDIIFEQATTNEALKVCLSKPRESTPELVFISTILNEIAARCVKGTSRETTIRAVTNEQLELINKMASGAQSGATLFVIIQPHDRQDPKWMEEKASMTRFYLMETFSKIQHSANMIVMPETNIIAEDLAADKVHLKPEGLKKVAKTLMEYIKNCKIELRRKRGEDLDWDEMDLDVLSQKTPKTNKKRHRNRSESEDEDNMHKKKKEDESVMAVLKTLMAEFREERLVREERQKDVNSDLASIKHHASEIKQRVYTLEQGRDNDAIYTATVKEDLDAVENEALKNVVIIKKLKNTTGAKLSQDRNALQQQILTAAKELVQEITADQGSVAYISLLYTGKEAVRLVEGFMPPFKIVFKKRQVGIEFKEKAVQLSKNPNHRLFKSYLTTQQTPSTRIRTGLMWAMADKIKDQAKGVDAWVTQNMPKPLLQVKGEERFQRGFSFVNAITKYGNRLDNKAKDEALKLAKRFYPGQVEKIFMVIHE